MKNSSLDAWVKARGFEQPYGSKSWIVELLVRNERLYLDLSATDPHYYNKVADELIANHFLIIGENNIRHGIKSLLKIVKSDAIHDPRDIEY